MLNQIRKEKDKEMIKVDMWCHFGHAYITKVDEGEWVFLLFAFRKERGPLKVVIGTNLA